MSTHGIDSTVYTKVQSFCIVCDSIPIYFVLDFSFIVKYDFNWNYLSRMPFSDPRFMICISVDKVKHLYVSSNLGLFHLDINLNILKKLASTISYQGLYYNKSSDYILVTGNPFINVFSRNLTLLKQIPTPNGKASNYIAEYNGKLYVSSASSIMVFENELHVQTLTCACISIRSFTFDQNGSVGINCHGKTNSIILLNNSGTYLGKWQTPKPFLHSFEFDASGNLVLAITGGLDILSPNTTKIISIEKEPEINNTCLFKSICFYLK
jgi:hypothetical protein